MAFFPTEAQGAIGSLDFPKPERKRLALLSPEWKCPDCEKKNCELLPETASDEDRDCTESTEEAKDADDLGHAPVEAENGDPEQKDEAHLRQRHNNYSDDTLRMLENVRQSSAAPRVKVVPVASKRKRLSVLTIIISLAILAILYRKASRHWGKNTF